MGRIGRREREIRPDFDSLTGMADDRAQTEGEQTCDFCGDRVENVRRIALDEGYERLQTPHKEQYACPTCSAEKEQSRRAAPPA